MNFNIDKIQLILTIGFFTVVALSILIFIIKLKIKKSNNVLALSSKKIALDTLITSSTIISSYVLIIFFLVGLLIFSAINEANPNGIVLIYIIATFLVAMPIIMLFIKIKNYLYIRMGKYALVVDELGDKKIEVSTDSENTKYTTYYLYFKETFPMYNCSVITDRYTYQNSKKGDKFYILFLKGNKAPLAFECKKYDISDEMKDKIIDVNDLEDVVNLKKLEFEVPEYNEITLNKKQVLKEYKKNKRKTAIVDVLITIFFYSFTVYSVYLRNIAATVILIFLALFFTLMSFVYIKNYIKCKREIKNGKYYFMEDEIVNVNKNISLKESNKKMSFKTKKFKRVLYGDRKIFNGTKEGEILILLFLDSDDNFPIRFYKRKNVIIEEKDKIKS